MMFDNFTNADPLYIGQLVKPDEPNFICYERVDHTAGTILPVGRCCAFVQTSDGGEHVRPLQSGDAIENLFGVVLEGALDVGHHHTDKEPREYRAGEMARIGVFKAVLSFSPYGEVKAGTLPDDPLALYVLARGAADPLNGAFWVQKQSDSEPTGGILLGAHFRIRTVQANKNFRYIEFNPMGILLGGSK
jgi:hypothetical protein